jgi:hypothetical protein
MNYDIPSKDQKFLSMHFASKQPINLLKNIDAFRWKSTAFANVPYKIRDCSKCQHKHSVLSRDGGEESGKIIRIILKLY